MVAQKFIDLFTFANYKFSTKAADRASSLYFQDITGNQGRWRREHPNGAALIYQGKSMRLFMNPIERRNFDPSKVRSIWTDFNDGIGATANYSLAPRNGWHVIEFLPFSAEGGPPNGIFHTSSGRVLLPDNTAGDAAYGDIADFDGDTSDYTA